MNFKFRLACRVALILLIVMTACTKQEPIASFSADNSLIAAGGSVKFSDQSLNNPVTWDWTFTGGTPASSTEQNPTVTYENAGKYPVSLSVTNSDGSDAVLRENYITVTLPSPVSSFSADKRTVDAGGYVNFTDQSTNQPASWLWLFEGGSPENSILQNPTVQYLIAGTYAVGLFVWNEVDTSYFEIDDYITVSLPPPEAGFTSDKTTVNAGGMINFTDQSTNQPTSWSWNFEGGTPSNSTLQNPSVQYLTEGTYNVSLLATNESGFDQYEIVDYVTVTQVGTTDITFENSTYTEIEIEINGDYKYIPSGGSVVYVGLMGNSVNYYASTSVETTGGTQVGYLLVWDNTINLNQPNITRTLLVDNNYYFLYIENRGSESFNMLEVGILDVLNGFTADRTEYISIPNNSVDYQIGYYTSYTPTQFNWIQIRAHTSASYVYWSQGTQFTLPDTSNQSIHLFNTLKKSSSVSDWKVSGDPETFLYPDYARKPEDQ